MREGPHRQRDHETAMGAGPSRGAVRPESRFSVRDRAALVRFQGAFAELKTRGVADLMDSLEGVPRLVDLLVAVVRDGFGDERISRAADDMRSRLQRTALAYPPMAEKIGEWRTGLPAGPEARAVGAVVRLLAMLLYVETRGALRWQALADTGGYMWDVWGALQSVGEGVNVLLK